MKRGDFFVERTSDGLYKVIQVLSEDDIKDMRQMLDINLKNIISQESMIDDNMDYEKEVIRHQMNIIDAELGGR